MTKKKEYAVELENIFASYSSDFDALSNLSLSIEKGIIQFIIGPNGAGKSTLIKVLNGIVPPKSGTLRILGKEYNTFDSLTQLRLQLGYIPQNLGLVKMKTVRENVLMGCLGRVNLIKSLFKIFPQEEIELADHLLEMVGLSDKADDVVYCLSGGEKRRVAIARALMQKPKILLADEILSDLDFRIAEDIMNKIKRLKKEFGITIIMVEHDIVTVKKFGDRIALIKDGEIKLETPVKKLKEKQLLALFSGEDK